MFSGNKIKSRENDNSMNDWTTRIMYCGTKNNYHNNNTLILNYIYAIVRYTTTKIIHKGTSR